METYYPSRRQDLLVGSLVSTLLISTLYWFGNGPHYMHVSPTTHWLKLPEFKLPPPDPDPQVDMDDLSHEKPLPVVAPVMQQLQDIPRPAPPDAFTQVAEPPHPDLVPSIVTVINNQAIDGGPGRTVWDPNSLDRMPAVTYQARPHYPTSMVQSGTTGEVMVDFIVDPNGNVRNATAVRSSNREFEAAAVEAVSKWKFKPGIKANHPVYTHMQVPIEFSLKSD